MAKSLSTQLSKEYILLSPNLHRSCNFYPNAINFGTYIGTVKLHFQLIFELYESHRSGNTILRNFKIFIKVVISIRMSPVLIHI